MIETTTKKQGRRSELSNSSSNPKSESWIYYTFVFVFEFDLGVSPRLGRVPPLPTGGTRGQQKNSLPEKHPSNQGMESLVNCASSRPTCERRTTVRVAKGRYIRLSFSGASVQRWTDTSRTTGVRRNAL